MTYFDLSKVNLV